jgi:hypothetical protein
MNTEINKLMLLLDMAIECRSREIKRYWATKTKRQQERVWVADTWVNRRKDQLTIEIQKL